MNKRYFIFLILAVLMLGGCSENSNNPVEGISSFDAGFSSSELYIELSSSEEIPGLSSSEEIYSSSSEDELSSSSGVDYSNWVLKKMIDWDCEDSLCNERQKSRDFNYDYLSYTDPEHYTVMQSYRSTSGQTNAEGEFIRKTWHYNQTTTTRNGLNYSGTVIKQNFTPDSLTLSYKEEYDYTSVHHPILIVPTYYEANGTKTYYENGEVVKTENFTGSGLETSVTDLGVIDGLHCYKSYGTSISCFDNNNLIVKSETSSSILTTTYNEILKTGEFAMWTGTTKEQLQTNEYESVREITERTNEKIVIVSKSKHLITEPVNITIYTIMEQHYGLP